MWYDCCMIVVPKFKQIFADRQLVEIRTERSVDVMRALDAMEEVEETSLFGTAVHAVLRSREMAPSEIVARLSAQHLAVESVEPVQPSLEDVFILLIRKASAVAA